MANVKTAYVADTVNPISLNPAPKDLNRYRRRRPANRNEHGCRRLNSINDRQLRYFVTVVETKNMTRAAELLHIAQPALGSQIRQLEASLDLPLLVRHSRGVEVTQAGYWVYERANLMLDILEEIQVDIDDFVQPKRQKLKIGLPPSLVTLVGSELLIAAKRNIPHVDVSLVENASETLAEQVERGEFDVALSYTQPNGSGVSFETVAEEELQLVCRPDIAPEKQSVSLKDVLQYELAMPAHSASSNGSERSLLIETASQAGMSPNIKFEVESLSVIKQLLETDDVATILPYGAVASSIKRGELVARRIQDSALKREVYFLQKEDSTEFLDSGPVAKFIRSIIKQISMDMAYH